MIESKVEQYFVNQCTKMGWLALKFTSPGTRAVPDRIVFLPNGRIQLVELKRPGGKPRPDQVAMHRRLKKQYRQSVAVLDSKAAVDAWIKSVLNTILSLNPRLALDAAEDAAEPVSQTITVSASTAEAIREAQSMMQRGRINTFKGGAL